MGSRALLVIDMQKDLCNSPKRRAKVDEMIGYLLPTIDLFSRAGSLIFYTYFSLSEDDEQFARFGDKYCIEGTEGSEFIPEILPLRGKSIKKPKHSAFFGTELDTELKMVGVSEVYLAGLQTQICILTTAADASFRGYKVRVIRECVVSTRDESKEQALEWISKYVGDVINFSDLI